jgi:SpoVK/Ycf46/Vps4 family AAA+-type ATPase
MWLGQSEKNVHALFEQARSNRPAVIFLDEVDAIGQKRANLRNNPTLRGTVNQLLSEMDGATSLNDGIFVLAATNQPWDVDPALRRPGRFDRTLFVSPPDRPAREAILRFHLQGRPLGSIDFGRLSRDTENFSGADLAHLCTLATRSALTQAARTHAVQPIAMAELEAARRQLKPSTLEWFATARHAATFANTDGTYDDLIAHLKSRKLW